MSMEFLDKNCLWHFHEIIINKQKQVKYVEKCTLFNKKTYSLELKTLPMFHILNIHFSFRLMNWNRVIVCMGYDMLVYYFFLKNQIEKMIK